MGYSIRVEAGSTDANSLLVPALLDEFIAKLAPLSSETLSGQLSISLSSGEHHISVGADSKAETVLAAVAKFEQDQAEAPAPANAAPVAPGSQVPAPEPVAPVEPAATTEPAPGGAPANV